MNTKFGKKRKIKINKLKITNYALQAVTASISDGV